MAGKRGGLRPGPEQKQSAPSEGALLFLYLVVIGTLESSTASRRQRLITTPAAAMLEWLFATYVALKFPKQSVPNNERPEWGHAAFQQQCCVPNRALSQTVPGHGLGHSVRVPNRAWRLSTVLDTRWPCPKPCLVPPITKTSGHGSGQSGRVPFCARSGTEWDGHSLGQARFGTKQQPANGRQYNK
ncbi:hypothetical protein Bbelb_229050 [Branchiostoma belcheri]|nr:hypothetical protein Bbelb_229050 [Branchiostoma belcheri]